MRHLYVILSCLLVAGCVKPIPSELGIEVAKSCASIGQKPLIRNTDGASIATCVPADYKF